MGSRVSHIILRRRLLTIAVSNPVAVSGAYIHYVLSHPETLKLQVNGVGVGLQCSVLQL